MPVTYHPNKAAFDAGQLAVAREILARGGEQRDRSLGGFYGHARYLVWKADQHEAQLHRWADDGGLQGDCGLKR